MDASFYFSRVRKREKKEPKKREKLEYMVSLLFIFFISLLLLFLTRVNSLYMPVDNLWITCGLTVDILGIII